MFFKSTNTRGGGGKTNSLKSLKAFTLAEVLITLVVIGIVAAITIPIIASNYQKRQLYSQFMKTYNTISNALNLAVIDYPNPMTWQTSRQNNKEYIKKYLLPYVNNNGGSKSLAELLPSKYIDLQGNSMQSIVDGAKSQDPYSILLPNGAVVFEYTGAIIFDSNGYKAPNVFGRDIFVLGLASKDCISEDNPICFEWEADDCLASNGTNDACAHKLLTDGAMKY